MTLSLAQNQDWIISHNSAAAAGAGAPVWLKDGLPAADSRHEAVLFIKPELACLPATTLQQIFTMIDAACAQYDVEVLNIGCLGYSYMAAHNIAGEHYGVINKISREGLPALAQNVQDKVRQIASVADDYVMGAHQFLQKFPAWTAEKLSAFVDDNAATTKKLAPGTYAMPIEQDGQQHTLLSGFHPAQLLHFTNAGRSIIVMPVRSKTSWKTLRDEMVGATDPSTAPAGALRAQLLANKDALGIPAVSKGLNGIHLSAGPLEGMVELVRFTSDLTSSGKSSYTMTNFGSSWLSSGGSESELNALADNPMVTVSSSLGGKTESAFDATELMDMSDAISTLKAADTAKAA